MSLENRGILLEGGPECSDYLCVCQKLGPHFPVMFCTVVLGPVVCPIFGPWHPIETELALCVSASEPVKSHVHSFQAAWLYSVVDHAMCCAIVGLDGSLRLGISQLL